MTAPAPANDPEHPRRQERKVVALSGWLIRDGGSERAHDFLLLDLSYGGCRLQTDAPLERGDPVRITVDRLGSMPAKVRWRDDTSVGLAFIDEPTRKQQPRQTDRFASALSVDVRRAGRRTAPLDASDISRQGCCLHFVDPPRADDLLWVTLPGLEAIEARVRWVEGHRAGVEFLKPIHAAVFDLLLLGWGIAPA